MEPRAQPRPARLWRERLARRLAFEAGPAGEAVRRVYRLAGLGEPGDLIWVDGPREAAQATAFLNTPPRRMRYVAVAGIAAGLLFWAALAFAASGGALPVESAPGAAVAGLALAALALYFAALRRLPVLPGFPTGFAEGQHDRTSLLLAAGLFAALAGVTFLVLILGEIENPFGRAGVVMLAGLCGALPGLYLLWRAEILYAPLPVHLRERPPARPVAEQLLRARRQAWSQARGASGTGFASGLRHAESLVRAFQQAFQEAFLIRPGPLQRLGAELAGTDLEPLPHDTGVPPHLDGIDDAARAAAVPVRTGAAAAFADLAFHVDRLFPFDSAAVAVRPPRRVILDAEDRPHSEAGPALEWADGSRVFAWHGRVVPAEIFDPARPLTLARIEREIDADLRWVMIERYGLGRYLQEAGALEIQRDECGQLYRLPQRVSETIYAVRVVNHTPEPDGSFREYWLAVPPTVATARQAVAWTFGLTPEEYRPVAQS